MRDKTIINRDTVRSGSSDGFAADPAHLARILRRVRRRGHPNSKLARRVAMLAEFRPDWSGMEK